MFERFTDRARRVLVLAQEEARLLNHGFIGTEHILLGLMGEAEGVAAKALESLGVNLDQVRADVAEAIEPGTEASPGSPPFTPRSKKVLELSLREALRLGHNYIGTEHMLLGLVREGEGVASQILVARVGNLTRVRDAVVELLQGYSRNVTTSPPAPIESWLAPTSSERRRSPAANTALLIADAQAKDAGRGINTLDLLLAILAEGRSQAALILAESGVTEDRVEERARRIGIEGTSDESPDEALARHVRLEYDADKVTIHIDDPAVAQLLMEGSGTEVGGAIMGGLPLVDVVKSVMRIAESLGEERREEAAEPDPDPPVTREEAVNLLDGVAEARLQAAASGQPKIEMTAHEADVLEGLAAGVSIADVAGFMGVSVEQAESMARNLRAKLDVHRRSADTGTD
jgi:ATP-dependent Clp protease ATP-binding subunit ClpC